MGSTSIHSRSLEESKRVADDRHARMARFNHRAVKVVDPLTNPTAHGGSAEDSFDLVILSLPGYGYSGKPTTTGWDPQHIAHAWVELMKRLGYKKYVAQGGDWGNAVTEQMALLAPPELVGIHTNMPATVPDDINKAALADVPAPSSLSDEEKHAYDQLAYFYKHGLGYGQEMAKSAADDGNNWSLHRRFNDIYGKSRRSTAQTDVRHRNPSGIPRLAGDLRGSRRRRPSQFCCRVGQRRNNQSLP
jgi:pimeloyl-ACP methyl ester carboxylesterase